MSSENLYVRLNKQIAKGGGTAFIGQIFGKIAAFGLHILLGQVLGAAMYGLYSLGRSIVGIAKPIASLGLKKGVVRYCSLYRGEKDLERVKGTIVSALGISAISSTVIALIIFIFSGILARNFFKEPDLAWVIRFFAAALPFYVLMGISASFAQSFRKIKYQQGILNFFLPVANFTLVALSFLIGFKLEGAIFGFIISGILSAGLGLYFLRKIFPQLFSLSFKTLFQINQLLRFSIPMFFIGMSLILLSYTDKIMLGFFKDAEQVGIYNAAAVISLQLTMSLGAFIIIFSPIVSDLFNRKKIHELKKLFKTVTRWGFSVSFPLFIILTVFSKEIVLVFGPEFKAGWNVLIVLAFAQLVNVGTGPVGMILQMTGKQNIDFFNGILLLFVNIGLNLWLIPIYGFLGAAAATATSLIIIHLLRLIEVVKIYRMGPYDKHHMKPVIAGIVMFVSGILFKMVFMENISWFLVAAGIIMLIMVYLGIIIGLGFNHEDKIIINAVKSKIIKAKQTLS